ncbi:YceD family protein [Luteimonas sp. e5]
MSAVPSQAVDVWRMVAAGRVLEGEWPLDAMPRLASLLDDARGVARYRIEFGRDSLGTAIAALRVEAGLPLRCQRSLRPFVLPLVLEQTLGLIREEADEAALPPGCEPLLVAADGRLVPADLVEDELILAVPAVPVEPGSAAIDAEWRAGEEEFAAANPFSALAALKGRRD